MGQVPFLPFLTPCVGEYVRAHARVWVYVRNFGDFADAYRSNLIIHPCGRNVSNWLLNFKPWSVRLLSVVSVYTGMLRRSFIRPIIVKKVKRILKSALSLLGMQSAY